MRFTYPFKSTLKENLLKILMLSSVEGEKLMAVSVNLFS